MRFTVGQIWESLKSSYITAVVKECARPSSIKVQIMCHDKPAIANGKFTVLSSDKLEEEFKLVSDPRKYVKVSREKDQ